MSMPDALDPLVGLRNMVFTGRDPDHLATVEIDADGIVTRVRFASTVGMHTVAAIERAVPAAIEAAEQQLAQAWQRLAEEVAVPEEGWS